MATIVEDLTAAKALIDESGKTIAAQAAELATVKASIVALTTERDNLTAATAKLVDEHAAALAAIVVEREKEQALAAAVAKELDASKGEVAKLAGQLRDPAFRAAIITESQTVPAGAEGGQTKTRAQLEAEYAAIPGESIEGAKARATFRETHKVALGL
jgi:hypothetical protein